MTKKCRVGLGMHSVAPHFFVILPSWVFQPSCCVSPLVTQTLKHWYLYFLFSYVLVFSEKALLILWNDPRGEGVAAQDWSLAYFCTFPNVQCCKKNVNAQQTICILISDFYVMLILTTMDLFCRLMHPCCISFREQYLSSMLHSSL